MPIIDLLLHPFSLIIIGWIMNEILSYLKNRLLVIKKTSFFDGDIGAISRYMGDIGNNLFKKNRSMGQVSRTWSAIPLNGHKDLSASFHVNS